MAEYNIYFSRLFNFVLFIFTFRICVKIFQHVFMQKYRQFTNFQAPLYLLWKLSTVSVFLYGRLHLTINKVNISLLFFSSIFVPLFFQASFSLAKSWDNSSVPHIKHRPCLFAWEDWAWKKRGEGEGQKWQE